MKRSLIAAAALILTAGIFSVFYRRPVQTAADAGYRQISQETAKEMMEQDDGHVIVDVRRQDEYDAGHIPGAICIPNESIENEQPEQLPDLDQTILVYCRSGNRSKQAAGKLAAIGYTQIYEFGGILDWTGEIAAKEMEASAEAASRETAAEEHMETMEEILTEAIITEETDMEKREKLAIEVNGQTYYAEFEANASAEAFIEKLQAEDLTAQLHDYGNFEKVGPLPWDLPRSDEQITTEPGDIILYQGNQITIYYDRNSWNFTRLAKIEGITGEELRKVLGDGDVTVTFSLK